MKKPAIFCSLFKKFFKSSKSDEKRLDYEERWGLRPYRRLDIRIAKHLADLCLNEHHRSTDHWSAEHEWRVSSEMSEYFRKTKYKGLDLINDVYNKLCYYLGQDLVHRGAGITGTMNDWYAGNVKNPPK